MGIPSEQALWRIGKSADEWLEENNKQVRIDAIEEYRKALHTLHNQNCALAKTIAKDNVDKYNAIANLDLEEIDTIAELLIGM